MVDLSFDDLCSVPKGKHMRISIYSKKGKIGSIASATAIEKARNSVDMPTRDQNRRDAVSSAGSWPSYSGDNPTAREALDWVTSVPDSAAKRTSAKDPESLLFCRCPDCNMIGLVRMNTRLHFCQGAKGVSLVASGSKVEFSKVVIPAVLYYSPGIRAQMDLILEQNPKVYRVGRNKSGQIVSIIKKEEAELEFVSYRQVSQGFHFTWD